MTKIRESFPRSKVKHPVYRASHFPGLARRSKDDPFYFADEPKPRAFGPYIIKAWINIRRPFLFSRSEIEDVVYSLSPKYVDKISNEAKRLGDFDPSFEDSYEWLIDQIEEGTWQMHQTPEIYKAIREQGYDGVITYDSFGGYTEYVVFEEEQIFIIDMGKM